MSADVQTIAETYLRKVKKSGPENIMAICPFHARPDGQEEATPSFTMSLTRGLYYCFACHERGNLAKFLKEIGVPRERILREYADVLAEVAKTRPSAPDPLKRDVDTQKPLPEGLLGLFDYCPTALLNEGFTEETLRNFDVGFDERHQRITFPLRGLQGELVGLSGRAVNGAWPRYKIYDQEYKAWGLPVRTMKRAKILWNAHTVYPEAYFSRDAEIVLVEGFKACMWLTQAGIRSTTALIGSYLSIEQQWILEGLGARIYVMLDNDEAGWRGREEVARRLARSLDVRIVEYSAPQPSDLEEEEVYEALRAAKDYTLWKIQGLTEKEVTAPESQEVSGG